jgi:cation transport ATPase
MAQSSEEQTRNTNTRNYPPILKLFHYDLNELKDPRELLIARAARWVYFAMCGVLFFNLVVMIILTIGAVTDAGYWIIYSTLVMLVMSAVGLFVHVWAFQSLVNHSTLWMILYIVAQSIMAMVYLVFSIVSGFNFEGWTNWTRASTAGGNFTPFWRATTIIESILWTFVAVGAVICVVLMSRHVQYSGGSSSVPSSNLSMQTKAKIARTILGF